ncbi:hypothetical protein ACFOKF_15430 [Sphingobium rhizovicinum]|uniref:Uncharacterized protein n=1 Tax=Sphingobium rhizovicinum TaxID=432308 RepID=A0ABV7NGD8_9SPHN
MTALQWLRFVPSLAIELIAQTIRWLAERPIRLLIAALILLSLWLWVMLGMARDLAEDRRVQAAAWHGKFVEQKAEMSKLVALVRAARIEAARLDQDNIRRVQDEWTATLSEVTHDYQTDLAAARALVAERLRQGSGAGAAGGAGCGGGAGMSGLPALSTGALRPGDAAVVDGADIDAVTENTVRLEHLIDAWKRAASIAVNRP